MKDGKRQRVRPLTMALLFLVACCAGRGLCEGVSTTKSLAGSWRFEMDRKDVGTAGAWFKRPLTGTIRLPGSMSENGLGDPISKIRQQVWGGSWTDQPIWHPMLKFDYRGAAWYQTTVAIPAEWEGRTVELFLERVCWQSECWVDDRPVGKQDSLSAPHVHSLGVLRPGAYRLTLRIDNRQLCDLGCNTHAYHEGSCTIYNGVIGRIELRSRPRVFLRDNQVYPDAETGACQLRLKLANETGAAAAASVEATLRRAGSATVLARAAQSVTVSNGEAAVTLSVPAPTSPVERWSEFERPLYELQVVLQSAAGRDERAVRFGYRSYTTRGAQFLINGNPVLLRGEASNAQFPLTGYPPMDKAAWLRILQLYKDFGLNHLRCHAFVPPEAAFEAADELGIYLQPELPNGEDSILNDKEVGLPWRRAELDRILDTYGNHPSFVQITMGNEAKTKQIEFLKELVQRGRQRDSRHLYACICNPEASGIRDEVPGDDFAVAHGSVRGRRRMEPYFNNSMPETMGDYRATMEGRPVPQICHEMGQWYVYPDLSEIEHYTGVLRPVTLEHFRQKAEAEGVLPQARDFMAASGKLSLLLYKEEIERSLRTPVYGGFDLLGLQDSFDQGAAYVGQVNSFFEPKPYLEPKAFRMFCDPRVLLARMAKRVWLNDETFAAELEFANYGPAGLKGSVVDWRVVQIEAPPSHWFMDSEAYWRQQDNARVVGQGQIGPVDLPMGLHPVGRISVPLSSVKQAACLRLIVGDRSTATVNRWNLWVYPRTCDTNVPAGVKVVSSLDDSTLRELREGARVVLLPSGFNSEYTTAMTPPFWSPIMFGNQKQILGLLCDPKHPALRGFPTERHSDWQWYELLFQGAAIRLQGVESAYRPIVQGIDRPDRNHKLALVYETKVGKGSLLVCTLDLNRDLDKRPVARQLRSSLLAYAAGAEFHPAAEISLNDNIPGGGRSSTLARLNPKISADSEHENNGALYAADNNPQTLWHTRWDGTATPPPHQLTIELKEPVTIAGFVQTPRTDCDHGRIAQYRFDVSDDGKTWRAVAQGTWPNSAEAQRVKLSAPVRSRFFRLEALKEVNGQPWTSVAEFDLILQP